MLYLITIMCTFKNVTFSSILQFLLQKRLNLMYILHLN